MAERERLQDRSGRRIRVPKQSGAVSFILFRVRTKVQLVQFRATMTSRAVRGEWRWLANRDQQAGGLFPTKASGPNRGRRVGSPEIRPAVNEFDRANVKIDFDYACVAAQRGMVLIGQPNFHGAGRSEYIRNDLPRDIPIRGTHSHHGADVHFEYKLAHGARSRSTNNTSDLPIPLDVPAARSVPTKWEKR
jgi:hypothetical protein